MAVDIVVDRIDVLVDGVVIANLQTPYEWLLPTSGLTPGDHVVTPRAMLGDQSITGTPITLHVDRTPVTGISSTDVSVGDGLIPGMRTPIHVTFNEALAPGSASTLGFVVTSNVSGPMNVAGTVTTSGAEAIFVPDMPWVEARVYSIKLTGKAVDRASNETPLSVSKSTTARTYWRNESTCVEMDMDIATNTSGDYVYSGIDREGTQLHGGLVVGGTIDAVSVSSQGLVFDPYIHAEALRAD